MKAKYYIGILSALLLTVIPLKAQYADNRDFRNNGASVVINNYYDDYDYYYTSRINRFHRSYAVFDYYSPLYTDVYWYNYRPFTWGLSIYGGSGFGIGFSYNYPVYYSGWRYGNWYGYNNGWYDPYFGSYWWGYDPFYYSWYSPVVINLSFGRWWGNNYRGWHGHNYWYNSYRPVYNTYNYYNYPVNRYYSSEYSNRGKTIDYNSTNAGGVTRREANPASGTRTGVSRAGNREIPGTTVNNNPAGTNNPTRRSAEVKNNTVNQGNSNGNVNNGNNRNSRINGNNGNFDQNTRNIDNSGNNRNSRTDGNNGNFRTNEQPAPSRKTSPSGTGSVMPERRSASTLRSGTPPRTGAVMSQGRSSSSSRTGSSVSQGRSSSTRSSTGKSSSGSSSSGERSRRK